jgi:Na+/melibiose symporter-like transporter
MFPADLALSAVSKDAAGIRNPGIIVMLTLSLLLMPAFPLWMRRQERLRRPTLIPNSLWGNTIFTCICLNVFLSTASFDATEQLTNLFFQNLQGLSPLQAAVRLIPMPISGIIVNSAMGLVVHRLRADWLVTGCIALTCASPLVLALMQPDWNYWPAGFFIVFLAPMGVDSLYTVSNLLISSMFPKKTQALAGGVFNTLSQIGQSFGIALLAAISNNVKNGSGDKDKDAKAALLQGYSASSWFFFALCATSLLMSVFGLRRIGKVGKKED